MTYLSFLVIFCNLYYYYYYYSSEMYFYSLVWILFLFLSLPSCRSFIDFKINFFIVPRTARRSHRDYAFSLYLAVSRLIFVSSANVFFHQSPGHQKRKRFGDTFLRQFRRFFVRLQYYICTSGDVLYLHEKINK